MLDIEKLRKDVAAMNAKVEEVEARKRAEVQNVPQECSTTTGTQALDLPGNDDPPDWENATSHKPDKLPPIVDAFEFRASPMPEPEELIAGIIHRGTKMMIGGGSKSFKTWVQLHMAVCVSTGKPWLGFETVKAKTLFCNLELHEAFFHKRLWAVTGALGSVIEKGDLDLWNLRGFAASYDVIIPEILRRTKESKYSLSIFDPIYKLYGDTDENSAGEVAKLVNSLETLAVETNTAIAFGAHFSKGNQSQKDAIDRTSGSGVWSRDPDSIITFTRHEEENCFTVEFNLRNMPPIEPFVVRWDYPIMRRDDNLDPQKLKQVAGRKKEHDPIKILSCIETQPLSIAEWSIASKVNRTTLYDYVHDFRSRGLIRTAGEGQKARQEITEKGLKFLSVGN